MFSDASFSKEIYIKYKRMHIIKSAQEMKKYVFLEFNRGFLKILRFFRTLLHRALLRSPDGFTKLLRYFEHCLPNSQKRKHGQYRLLIGVMFTTNRPRGPLQTHYEMAESRAPASLCFKVTRRSCIERSDTCGRPFIVRFYRRQNGRGLSSESVIICAKNLYSFVVVGETIRGTFATRLLIRTCIITIQFLFFQADDRIIGGFRAPLFRGRNAI